MTNLIGNNSNTVANPTATNFIASNAIVRTGATKTGGGQVNLSGDYTGAADSIFDVEILNNTIVGAPLISEPVFVGVGSGDMSLISADGGTLAQSITAVLSDLGTKTTNAYANFGEVTLEAKAAGPAGNSIVVSVDRSALVSTASNFSVPASITKENNEYIGNEWDFGAATLEADGTIPDSAPRLRFGNRPTVYRQYRKFIDGRYVYSFSPQPRTDIESGELVYLISGNYSATVTDGIAPENYTAIESLYGLLAEIEANSLLVSVVGVVANDKLPGKMGALDLNVFTESYLLNVETSGSGFIDELGNLSITATAPTQATTITCVDNSTVGSEQWEIVGEVSGKETNRATTGIAFNSGDVRFIVPTVLPESSANSGSISASLSLTSRADAESSAVLCSGKVNPILGARAKSGEYKFTYTKRIDENCDCSAISTTGGPDEICLGVGVDPVLINSMQAPYRYRSERVKALVATLGDAEINVAQGESTATMTVNQTDRDAVKLSGNEFISALVDLNDGETTNPAWATVTLYAEDSMIDPGNNFRYRATNAGTSDVSEPVWPTTIGSTVVDGGVTWECLEKTALKMWDDRFADFQADVDLFTGSPLIIGQVGNVWEANSFVSLGQLFLPTTRNGHYYAPTLIAGSGQTGASEPTWPTDGSTVVDNEVTFRDQGAYWEASTAKSVGDLMNPYRSDGVNFKVQIAGTTSATEPDWDTAGDTVVDGTVTWEKTGVGNPLVNLTELKSGSDITYDPSAVINAYAGQWADIMDEVRIAGGILNFDGAGGTGGRCWQELDTSYWWVSSDGLLPAFTNTGYHSAKRTYDSAGNESIASTQEFFFIPAIACEENLKEGDVIIVHISGVLSGTKTYQINDRFTVTTVNAEPLQMGGGQNGNDTLTWAVTSSIDGRIADYSLLTTAPPDYNTGGIHFTIEPGAIDFALGDTFTFALEGGQFRWRKDAGAWSANTQIANSVVLSDGLSADFEKGKAPSFEVGDLYEFEARAVNGPLNILQPTDDFLSWETTGTTIEFDAMQADTLMIGLHSIDSAAIITLQGSDDNFSSTPLNDVVTYRAESICHTFDTAAYAKYRVIISTGDGSIGWVYFGVPWSSSRDCGQFVRSLRLAQSISGINGTGAFIGSAFGGTLSYEGLTNTDADSLLSLIDHAFRNDHGRFGLIPSRSHLDECSLVRGDFEAAELTDFFRYHPEQKDGRALQVSIPMEGVIL